MAKLRILDKLGLADAADVPAGGAAILPHSPGGLPPIVVFKILRERFGKPNSQGDPDKTHWEWALTGTNGVLTVYDYKDGWSIGFRGRLHLKETLDNDAAKLLYDFQAIARRTKIGKPPVVGGIITNPYRIFAEMAENLFHEATEILQRAGERERIDEDVPLLTVTETDPKAPARDRESIELPDYVDAIMGVGRVRSLLIAAMLAHVVSVEGFLNLVYHLFTKPGLAEERVRERIEREQLDLKLRLLDTFCDCFESAPVNPNDELFKAYAHLITVRTNLAHAKLTKFMEEAIVVEEERYPFVLPTEAPSKYGISLDPLNFDTDMVERAGRIVRTIVRRIIWSMTPETRYPFAKVHYYKWFNYSRSKDGSAKIALDPDDARVPDEWMDEMLGGSEDDWQPAVGDEKKE